MTLVNKPAGILAERSSLLFLDLVHNVTKLDIWVFNLLICVHQNDACNTFQNNSLLVYLNGFSHWLLFAFSVKFVCLYSCQCNAHATCQTTEEQTFDSWEEQSVFLLKSSRQALTSTQHIQCTQGYKRRVVKLNTPLHLILRTLIHGLAFNWTQRMSVPGFHVPSRKNYCVANPRATSVLTSPFSCIGFTPRSVVGGAPFPPRQSPVHPTPRVWRVVRV